MSEQQLSKFESLLAAWRNHDDLRRTGAPITDLVSSRFQLDEARQAARGILR